MSPRLGGRKLTTRVVWGLLLAAVALGAARVGGLPFTLLVSAGILAALVEFYRLALRAGYPVLWGPGLLAAGTVLVFGATHDPKNVGVVFVVLGIWMIGASLRAPIEGRLAGLGMTILGVLYTAGLGIHLLWLRELDRGLSFLILVFLGTWSADTFAFFVGVRWGRTPLAPHVSPKKSVEGFLGGLAGTILVVTVAARVMLPQVGVGFGLVAGAVIGVASPLGDLLESMIKRNLNTKDASRAIPGHGGVLDRIDSLLVAAPVAYYLFRFWLVRS